MCIPIPLFATACIFSAQRGGVSGGHGRNSGSEWWQLSSLSTVCYGQTVRSTNVEDMKLQIMSTRDTFNWRPRNEVARSRRMWTLQPTFNPEEKKPVSNGKMSTCFTQNA